MPCDTETPKRMQTSDPKTENLNQLKDPQYMVHLHKSIIENLPPRDTALENSRDSTSYKQIPEQRRDSSFYKKIPQTTVGYTSRISTHSGRCYHLEQKPDN